MKAIEKKKGSTLSGVLRHMNREFLFSCIVWLAVCPLWGQTNLGIDAHLENDRLLLELDKGILETPMHLVRLGVGYHHIQWSRQGDHILVSLSLIESETGTLIPPIVGKPKIHKQLLGRFEIIGNKGTDHSMVIDATDLFLKTHIQYEFYSKQNVVSGLSFVERVDRYPDQLIIRTQRTIEGSDGRKTIDADFSLYQLTDPMQPRLYDQRMAFNSEVLGTALDHENQAPIGSIERWRLEKKDESKDLVPPVRPIVFYLDSQIPDPWKPYVKQGVLEWLTALEAAGFKDAIEVREMTPTMVPGLEQLKNTAMVHWKMYEKINELGNGGSTCFTVLDKRSGEILRADVLLSGLDRWAIEYFVRCAPLDPRAQKFPFPEDLMGELIQSVTAHEVGHALGLRDGNFGEHAYPFEKMRDTDWLREMSHVPSIMSYSRHHHIAQPGDSIPPSLLMQRVGPMDRYQIKWGYVPLDGLDYGQRFLENLVQLQDSIPYYRYNFKKSPALGPDSSGEVADNDDPVRSMALGLKNLESAMEMASSIGKGQKDDDLLKDVHLRAIRLWHREMAHVLSMVGGYTVQLKSGDQKGLVYTPVPFEEQERALKFLMENAFDVPQWLSEPAYLGRIQNAPNPDWLLFFQSMLIKELMSAERMKRMEFMEQVHGFEGLTEHMLAKVMEGMFKELDEKKIVVDSRRQALQKILLAQLASAIELEGRLNNANDQSGGNLLLYNPWAKSLIAMELQKIRAKMEKGIKKSTDKATKGHLTLCGKYWKVVGDKPKE
ncbi:MAG: zinc-dependent metalloprotease [Flagellimonas sp.]